MGLQGCCDSVANHLSAAVCNVRVDVSRENQIARAYKLAMLQPTPDFGQQHWLHAIFWKSSVLCWALTGQGSRLLQGRLGLRRGLLTTCSSVRCAGRLCPACAPRLPPAPDDRRHLLRKKPLPSLVSLCKERTSFFHPLRSRM